jgi:HPt (histidine-containing phosphotransfer) domain-containing protein
MGIAAKTVDYDHLRVQAGEDLGVMREVLALFVTHGEQVLAELEQTNDEKIWKRWTHTLKGSARGVGAFAVAEAAADAELHLLDKTKLQSLKTVFAEARSYIGMHPV